MAEAIQVRKIQSDDRERIQHFLTRHWGEPRIVSRGRIHQVDELPGFIVMKNQEVHGLLTFKSDGEDAEIVSLDALPLGVGMGSALIEAMVDHAQDINCSRVWLITTNDNLDALRFYQRRGFVISAIHRNAVAKARELKPTIPMDGHFRIPIRDEIELERQIPCA